jgi:3-deoxy-D-manno-octulosonic-acid transferase
MDVARALYTLAGTALLPFLPLRLWWRGRREPGYRRAWGERFGRYRTPPPSPRVWWVHAVSVGETRAAVPLLEHLRRAYPDMAIVLTHMTATGLDTGRALYGDTVMQAWLPYDLPFAVDAFLDHFRPAAGFLLETELWPNLIAHAAARHVPVYLVNARLSERSSAGYRRYSALTRPMLMRLAGVAAQSGADEARLAELGARNTVVTGNLKFDMTVPDTARALGAGFASRFGSTRNVWIAASTREGEEALLLDALARAPLPPETLLVIVPRHPQRFAAVADLLHERAVPFVRRSDNRQVSADVRVVLGDSMGELFSYYAAADLAFVGGSLLPLGGQNMIEPLALGVPVLIGPHSFNFAEATAGAVAAGAAEIVADADALVAAVRAILSAPARRRAMGAAARAFHAAHQGAADRLWSWLAPQLAAALASAAKRADRG